MMVYNVACKFTIAFAVLFVICVLLMICVYVCYSDDTREQMRKYEYEPPLFAALAWLGGVSICGVVISCACALVSYIIV